LFSNLEDAPKVAHCGVADEDIFWRMQEHSQGDMVLEEDDGIYEKGDILRSFHHQARRPMSWKALLAKFLSVWLKRCVVPSPSSDVILPTVLLPAIHLVHGCSLGLLPAMVCCIQRGLRALTEGFCRPPMTKRGKGTILPRNGPNPRIGLPYTYLMLWFALHYPAIIQAGEEPPEGVRMMLLRRFEGFSWLRTYVTVVRKLMCRHDVYSLFWCFSFIRDVGYDEEFKDVEKRRRR